MSFEFLDIGLPFFDDVEKQLSKQSYFNSHIVDWKSADNRFLPFLIEDSLGTGMSVFEVINVNTGAATDFLAYFTANVVVTLDDGKYYYQHYGLVDISLGGGRYYFHAVNTNGSKEWWSEEFVMCGNIDVTTDYLLISSTDYLLIGATDRLLIG